MIDKQVLIDDFVAENPQYASKQLEIEMRDDKYDINMIKKNGKIERIRTVTTEGKWLSSSHRSRISSSE